MTAAMRVLLKDKQSGLYFSGPERWTRERAKACDFRMADRAVHGVFEHGLRNLNMEIVYDFAIPRLNILNMTVPLTGPE